MGDELQFIRPLLHSVGKSLSQLPGCAVHVSWSSNTDGCLLSLGLTSHTQLISFPWRMVTRDVWMPKFWVCIFFFTFAYSITSAYVNNFMAAYRRERLLTRYDGPAAALFLHLSYSLQSVSLKLVPQKIAILRHAIFPQFRPCWRSMQFLSYSTIFQLLLNCSLDGRDRPVTANVTTVILMEKDIGAIPSRQFAFSRQEYTAERCGAVLSLKLIGLHVAGPFCIHVLLLSAQYLVTGMTHSKA